MKLKEWKDLIDNAINVLGPDAPMILIQGYGEKRKLFDFGEQGRDGYCCSITPYEVMMWTDALGRYALPIREVAECKEALNKVTLKEINEGFTPKEKARLLELGKKYYA